MSSPSHKTRRTIILTALATAVHASAPRSAAAEEDPPGSDLRPQKADVLVFAEGDRAGEVIKPQDLIYMQRMKKRLSSILVSEPSCRLDMRLLYLSVMKHRSVLVLVLLLKMDYWF